MMNDDSMKFKLNKRIAGFSFQRSLPVDNPAELSDPLRIVCWQNRTYLLINATTDRPTPARQQAPLAPSRSSLTPISPPTTSCR